VPHRYDCKETFFPREGPQTVTHPANAGDWTPQRHTKRNVDRDRTYSVLLDSVGTARPSNDRTIITLR
jgi:hypothetical protein